MRVTIIGCPRPVGGANTECGDTALMWRAAGWDVTIIPTWDESPDNPWPGRLIAAGCHLVSATEDTIDQLPGIADSTLVAFCNQHACRAWPKLKALGCRLIYSPCMTYPTAAEREVFTTCPPTAIHFQSRFQTDWMGPQYAEWGVPHARMFLIHGAFDLHAFPFQPAAGGRQFTVGRLARPITTKWPRALWPLLEAARQQGVDLRALCMGWNVHISAKCGDPPQWAECLPANSWPSRLFLYRCDALLCMNGGDKENWPRVGLEAMAAGVPIIAERKWGWTEMLDNSTAVLVETPQAATAAIVRLARDDVYRNALIENARTAVALLADHDELVPKWEAAVATVSQRGA